MLPLAPAVAHAIKLIELLSIEPEALGISEISRRLGLNKNMVYRILNTLEEEKWVYSDEEFGGKYRLTLRPFQITSMLVTRLSLNTVAVPYLYNLWKKNGDSIYLGILKDNKVVYIQHFDSIHNVRVAGVIGGSYPLHCSAPGKVLLAYSDDNIIEQYCAKGLEKFTENTIIDKFSFTEHLTKIRTDGYAVDLEEYGYGIICFAAPVFDYTGKVIGSVGTSLSLIDENAESMMNIKGPNIQQVAKEISIQLGYMETGK